MVRGRLALQRARATAPQGQLQATPTMKPVVFGLWKRTKATANVAESGKSASGRAQLRALTQRRGMGRLRENANRGDPVGTLSGPSRVRVHFAGA